MAVTSSKISKTGEHILTASMPVGITCRKNVPCYTCRECYGLCGNMAFPVYKKSMMNNLKLYKENPVGYYKEIDTALTITSYKYFRWFVTGDIVDKKFLSEIMVKLAEAHPEVKFLCFTKKYELVNEYLNKGNEIPSNLTIVFSSWGSLMPRNYHNLPVSYVRFKDECRNVNIPKDAFECRGKCEKCLCVGEGCWNLKSGQSVVFKKH